jgi:hypothetical protein
MFVGSIAPPGPSESLPSRHLFRSLQGKISDLHAPTYECTNNRHPIPLKSSIFPEHLLTSLRLARERRLTRSGLT